MQSKRQLGKYLHSMDNLNIEKLDEDFSNFRFLGIGKETEAQKKRRERLKKKISDAGKNIKEGIKDAGKNIKEKLDGGKGVHAFNKVSPTFIALRGSLLSMINLNLFGIATNLYQIKSDSNQKYWNDILQKFWMWGGDKEKFSKSVEKGNIKKQLAKDVIDKISAKKYGFNSYNYADGKGAENAGIALKVIAGVGAATATALTFIPQTTAIAPFVGVGSAGLGAMSPIFDAYAKSKGVSQVEIDKSDEISPTITDEQLKKIAEDIKDKVTPYVDENNESDNQIDNDKILGMSKGLAIGLGIAVLAIGGFIVYKKFIAKK